MARSEAGADALRDALALVRATLDGDEAAVAVVAQNVSWPALTMAVMADWIAEQLRMRGLGRDTLDEWQTAEGLR
jgi:hypothetical protein